MSKARESNPLPAPASQALDLFRIVRTATDLGPESLPPQPVSRPSWGLQATGLYKGSWCY